MLRARRSPRGSAPRRPPPRAAWSAAAASRGVLSCGSSGVGSSGSAASTAPRPRSSSAGRDGGCSVLCALPLRLTAAAAGFFGVGLVCGSARRGVDVARGRDRLALRRALARTRSPARRGFGRCAVRLGRLVARLSVGGRRSPAASAGVARRRRRLVAERVGQRGTGQGGQHLPDVGELGVDAVAALGGGRELALGLGADPLGGGLGLGDDLVGLAAAPRPGCAATCGRRRRAASRPRAAAARRGG